MCGYFAALLFDKLILVFCFFFFLEIRVCWLVQLITRQCFHILLSSLGGTNRKSYLASCESVGTIGLQLWWREVPEIVFCYLLTLALDDMANIYVEVLLYRFCHSIITSLVILIAEVLAAAGDKRYGCLMWSTVIMYCMRCDLTDEWVKKSHNLVLSIAALTVEVLQCRSRWIKCCRE